MKSSIIHNDYTPMKEIRAILRLKQNKAKPISSFSSCLFLVPQRWPLLAFVLPKGHLVWYLLESLSQACWPSWPLFSPESYSYHYFWIACSGLSIVIKYFMGAYLFFFSLKLETQLCRSQSPPLTESSCSINISSRKEERVGRATELCAWEVEKEAWRSTKGSLQLMRNSEPFPLSSSCTLAGSVMVWDSEYQHQFIERFLNLNVSECLIQEGPSHRAQWKGTWMRRSSCFESKLFVAQRDLELTKWSQGWS